MSEKYIFYVIMGDLYTHPRGIALGVTRRTDFANPCFQVENDENGAKYFCFPF